MPGNGYAEEFVQLRVIAVDTIDEMLVHESLPVGTEAKQDGLSHILLLGLRLDDSLGLDYPLHEATVAGNGFVERNVIVLKVCLFQLSLAVGVTSHDWTA